MLIQTLLATLQQGLASMIDTIFETGHYRLDFDTRYGTSWFVRKKDDYVSFLNTGTDAIEEKEWAEELDPSVGLHRSCFNSIAEEHTFEPRFERGISCG